METKEKRYKSNLYLNIELCPNIRVLKEKSLLLVGILILGLRLNWKIFREWLLNLYQVALGLLLMMVLLSKGKRNSLQFLSKFKYLEMEIRRLFSGLKFSSASSRCSVHVHINVREMSN